MRSFKSVIVVLGLGLLGPGLASTRGALFGLFPDFWGDVIVATDMTPEGRKLTPPTVDKPVYYLGRSLGERLGTIRGDTLPKTKELNQVVAKVLAKQGYLGATPGVNDPTLYLVVQWGYIQPGTDDLLWFLGYNTSQDIAAPAFPGQLGPEIWRRGFRSRETETVLEDAKGPIYGIIVTAFEYKSARTPQPVIYWQTRIGLPANGKSMEAALPTMLLAAGPTIGLESDRPLLRDADNVHGGHVKLGELKIINVLDAPPDDTGAKK